MDNALELTAIFRLPLLWCAIFLCVGSAFVCLASPRFLKAINAACTGKVEVQGDDFLKKQIDADSFLLRHSRLFGACALVTGIYLFFQIA